MKQKLFTLLTLLLCAVSTTWASTVDDLAVISKDHSIAFADIMNGVKFEDGTLYDNNYILSIGGNNYANNKGTNSTLNKLNCCRIKSDSQDRLAFKVSGECTFKIYGETRNDRLPVLSTDGTATAKYEPTHANDADVITFSITEAGTYYIVGSGDRFLAGIEIVFPVTDNSPTINAQPAGATYEVDDEATALSVSATATSGGALSYQWYSNTTSSTEGAIAIKGATSSTYMPSTASAGTIYYYCTVTEAGNEDVATTKIVAVTVRQMYTINFATGESGSSISFPTTFRYESGTKISLPTNHYFYTEGRKVVKWSDGTNDYALGASYTVSGDMNFYPMFENDNITLGEEATTITWAFNTGAGAPSYSIQGDGKSTTVIGTTANGKDLILGVSCSVNPNNANEYGKFNNTSNSAYSQVNKWTSFTIPAVKGMTVTYTSGAVTHTDETLFDFGSYASDIEANMSNNNLVFTYNGTEENITFTDKEGSMWPTGITVSYPYTGAALPPEAEAIEKTPIIWDFTNLTAQSFTQNSTYSFKATDGTTEMRYSAGSSDVIIAKEGNNDGYLKENGKTGGGTVTDIDGETNVGKTRLIRLYVTGKGKLTINCTSSNVGVFDVKDGSTSGTTLIDSYTANIQSPEITVSNFLWIETTTKGYINTIVWTPSSDAITLTTTINMDGWRAFYDDSKSYTVDENTKIYTVTAKDETKAMLTEVTGRIPAQTPVLLKTSDANRTMTLTAATTGDAINTTGNLLQATNGSAVSNVYRLGYGAEGVGFYQYSATNPANGIVYLPNAGGAKALTFSFSDVTGISNAAAAEAANAGTGKMYNLSGQIVGEGYKGIVIVNGKKVIK